MKSVLRQPQYIIADIQFLYWNTTEEKFIFHNLFKQAKGKFRKKMEKEKQNLMVVQPIFFHYHSIEIHNKKNSW